MANQLFWCGHPTLHCISALKEKAQYITQQTGIKQIDELIMNHQPKQELSKCDLLALQGVNDLIQLSNGSIENILHLLRVRFYKGQIYTQLSNQNLIAINPEQMMQNLFCQNSLLFYKRNMRLAENQYQKLFEIPPHIYKIGDLAKQEIFSENNKWKNCSIIAMGENGSGKTTNVNALIYYLAKESKSGKFESAMLGTSIEKKIEYSTPILQAFGSASTQQNKQSTRFGKYLEIQFYEKIDEKSKLKEFRIIAGQITAYLLERSRVSSTPANESNFKIFEYLLAGYHSRNELKAKILQLIPDYSVEIDDIQQQIGELELLEASNYTYLSNTKKQDIESNLKEFLTICECLSIIEFESDQIMSIFKVLSGILYLGNITINGVEISSIDETDNALVKASCNLGIPMKQLSNILTESKGPVGNKEIKMQFNSQKARENRDALAKHLYVNLFEVIIQQINMQIGSEGIQTEKKQKLVLFDSLGYEKNLDSETGQQCNGFEQFNINYTNEKLKSFQVDQSILIDQDHYQQERIAFKLIDMKQSKAILYLYERPTYGLYSQIKDFTSSAKGDDQFINKLQNQQFTNDLILRTTQNYKIQFQSDSELKALHRHKQQWFGINHTSGAIIYFLKGFFDKNKDHLNDNIQSQLRKSGLELIKQIQNNHEQKELQLEQLMQAQGFQQQKNERQFINQIYQGQMKQIIQKLSKTKPFFLNCLRANTKQLPINFDSLHVLENIKAISLDKILDFKIKGYPNHMKQEEFLHTFKMVFPKVTTIKKLQQKLNNSQEYNHITQSQLIKFGQTEIFMKNEVIDFFQSQINLVKKTYAKRIINLLKVNLFRNKLKNKPPLNQYLKSIEQQVDQLEQSCTDNLKFENSNQKQQIESLQALLNLSNQSIQQSQQYIDQLENQLLYQQNKEQQRKEQLQSAIYQLYNMNDNKSELNLTQLAQHDYQQQQQQQQQFSSELSPQMRETQSYNSNKNRNVYVGPLNDLQVLINNLQNVRLGNNTNQMEKDSESQENDESEHKTKISDALKELQNYLLQNDFL